MVFDLNFCKAKINDRIYLGFKKIVFRIFSKNFPIQKYFAKFFLWKISFIFFRNFTQVFLTIIQKIIKIF